VDPLRQLSAMRQTALVKCYCVASLQSFLLVDKLELLFRNTCFCLGSNAYLILHESCLTFLTLDYPTFSEILKIESYVI
jgi:hypothetical protein